MKGIYILLALSACCLEVAAQKQAYNWYFGSYAGLDFSVNCQPTQKVDSHMATMEGSATMSDAETGKLLFYSDAIKVWNGQHQLMAHSGDEDPRPGINRQYNPLSQGALIVPDPANSSVYYLFNLSSTDTLLTGRKPPGMLTYSRIDMKLDEGKGDVILDDKSTFLADGLVGRLTAIPNSNGKDYWLLTHQWGTNAFLVYPITAAGIGKPDTIQIGSVINDVYGFLKASPDGRKLACTSRGIQPNPFDLFDFDSTTGEIKNYINLGAVRTGYGVSFSPDNSKLYVSTRSTAGTSGSNIYLEFIRQYDLKAGNAAQVAASGKGIIYQNPNTNINLNEDSYSDFYSPSLQIGPDGKIYCASNSNSLLCPTCGYRFFVISKPNESGFACEINVQVAELGNGVVGNASDLPNFMQQYFNGLVSENCLFDKNEGCDDRSVLVFPNPVNNLLSLLVTDICFSPYYLRIINVAGQVLSSHTVSTPRSQQINVSRLSAGIYLAELRFKNRTLVKRFLKY
jgi:hypothetical protein